MQVGDRVFNHRYPDRNGGYARVVELYTYHSRVEVRVKWEDPVYDREFPSNQCCWTAENFTVVGIETTPFQVRVREYLDAGK